MSMRKGKSSFFPRKLQAVMESQIFELTLNNYQLFKDVKKKRRNACAHIVNARFTNCYDRFSKPSNILDKVKDTILSQPQ